MYENTEMCLAHCEERKVGEFLSFLRMISIVLCEDKVLLPS